MEFSNNKHPPTAQKGTIKFVPQQAVKIYNTSDEHPHTNTNFITTVLLTGNLLIITPVFIIMTIFLLISEWIFRFPSTSTAPGVTTRFSYETSLIPVGAKPRIMNPIGMLSTQDIEISLHLSIIILGVVSRRSDRTAKTPPRNVINRLAGEIGIWLYFILMYKQEYWKSIFTTELLRSGSNTNVDLFALEW